MIGPSLAKWLTRHALTTSILPTNGGLLLDLEQAGTVR